MLGLFIIFTQFHVSVFSSVATLLTTHTRIFTWFAAVLEPMAQYKTHLFFTGFSFASSYWRSSVSAADHIKPIKSKGAQPHVHFRAFHRKYVILSCYMLTAWFYSVYVQPFVHTRPYKCTEPQFLSKPDLFNNTNLIYHMDECNKPLVQRTPLQNKILLQKLNAFQTPQKQVSHTHFNSNAFNICVNIDTSSTCTSSKDNFVINSYVPLKGATINGIASGLNVVGYGTIQ